MLGINSYVLAAAGIAIAIAGGGYLWERGRAIEATAQRDAALVQVAALTEANRANIATIADLKNDLAANEILIDQYADQVDALRQQAADAAAAIRKLAAENATVHDYLSTPIPDDLRGLLNNGSAPAGSH